MTSGTADAVGRQVYFEFMPMGGSMRVTAIDSLTAIEVVILAPVATPRADLERLALRKLKNRLDREHA